MEDQFLLASQEYLNRRHETALRLLAACDKQAGMPQDEACENDLRDKALLALVSRDYSTAAELTKRLADMSEQKQHLLQRCTQLRKECDRLREASSVLEERQELLQQAPESIEDPYISSVGGYLEKRHETALRLIAALDAEVTKEDASDALRVKRERLLIEIDALSAAMQVQAERDELLDSAEGALGEGAPNTAVYLRRVVAYLDARSRIVLKLIASIDKQLADGADGKDRDHLTTQRDELVKELDGINEKIAAQKRGETALKDFGLSSDALDPYCLKVTTYLQHRSDVALQLIAFLDQRLESLQPDASDERGLIVSRRDELRRQTDDAFAQIAQQEQGQAIMDKLGVPARAAGYP